MSEVAANTGMPLETRSDSAALRRNPLLTRAAVGCGSLPAALLRTGASPNLVATKVFDRKVQVPLTLSCMIQSSSGTYRSCPTIFTIA